MKATLFSIFLTLLLVSMFCLPSTFAQDYTTWNLPEGAKARLGKGTIEDIQFSPDNKLLAVAGSIGVWVYDVDTDEELALLTGHTSFVTSIAFSPNGELLASGSWDTTIRLWNVSSFTLNKTLTGHTSGVMSVAFSSDGKTLASGSVDKTVRLWNVFTGTEEKIFTGHTDQVASVAFGLDDARLASGSWDTTIRLWDVETGEHQQTFTGHTDRVTSIAFSPAVSLDSDGKTLVSGSWDKTVRLWDVETGEYKQILTGHKAPVTSVCFRPDGYMLASADWGGLIRLWATVSGELKQEFFTNSWDVNSVCFSPDGFILAGGQAPTIQLWEVLPTLKYGLRGHTDSIGSVSFSPDGSMFVSRGGNISGDDETIRLWDVETGALKQTFTTEDAALVFGVSFLSDGQTIASVGRELSEEEFVKYQSIPTLRLWDVSTGRLKRTFNFNEDWIWNYYNPSFSPDGLTLAIAENIGDRDPLDKSQSVRLFDVLTGSRKHTLTGHTDYINSVIFSPDGETLASGSLDETIRVWDVSTGRLKYVLIRHTDGAPNLMFSPDGKTLASRDSYEDPTIRLWDAATGEHLHTLIGSEGDVSGLVFSPDGKTITTMSFLNLGHNMRLIWHVSRLPALQQPSILWDVSSGELKQSDNPFSTIDGILSPDGLTLVNGNSHTHLYLWDLSTVTPTPKQTITGHSSSVYSVSFGPDGDTVAIGSDTAIHLWDVDTATPTLKDTYPFNATTVAFSASHQRLLSGGWDPTIRLWDVASNRQEKTFIGHTGSINSVEFTIGSREFASGSADKTIRLWNVGIGETTQTFTGHRDSVLTLVVNPHHIGGVFLASGSADKTVLLWDRSYRNGEEPYRTLTGHTDAVLSVAYNPHKVFAHPDLVTEDGGFQVMLASGSVDKALRLWDGGGGAHQGTLTGHSGGVSSVAFSPNGETLMSGSYDATIRWWELGKVVESESLTGGDHTVIWEDPFIGTHKHTFVGHTGGVTCLAFSLVLGWTLASGSYDGTVLLWDVRFEPSEPADLVTDINDDGVVNIQDLVLVASNLGETGENPADVNDDGVVNIQDLVQVAGELGNAAAAPATWSDDLVFAPTRAEVEQWLTQARQLNLTDATSQRGIRFLEQLLLALTPKETALLANYPNPFNPETWIPYQLATPANVTLRIYAVDGSLIRTLSLGHKAVGIYQTRSRATYWDGKNELGEPVASGVYFYTLTAGDFIATRKMLIRK